MSGLDLIGGALCMIAAAAFATRAAVLSPSAGAWPDAGPLPRAAMFVAAMIFGFRGIELTSLALEHDVSTLTPIGVLALGALAFYSVVMAANVLRQVLPPHVWDRLKRVNGLAFCPPRGRLALLALAGVRVIKPGASSADLIDELDPSARHTPAAPRRRPGPKRTGLGHL